MCRRYIDPFHFVSPRPSAFDLRNQCLQRDMSGPPSYEEDHERRNRLTDRIADLRREIAGNRQKVQSCKRKLKMAPIFIPGKTPKWVQKQQHLEEVIPNLQHELQMTQREYAEVNTRLTGGPANASPSAPVPLYTADAPPGYPDRPPPYTGP